MRSDKNYVSRTAEGLTHFNTLVVKTYWVRLFDPFNVPMPNAPYRVTLGERQWEGEADEEAWLKLRFAQAETRCLLEWGRPAEAPEAEFVGDAGSPDAAALLGYTERSLEELLTGDTDSGETPEQAAAAEAKPGEPYLYTWELHLDMPADNPEEALRRRLHNFGFHEQGELEENIRAFQQALGREPSGQAADIEAYLSQWHDDCEPERWAGY